MHGNNEDLVFTNKVVWIGLVAYALLGILLVAVFI